MPHPAEQLRANLFLNFSELLAQGGLTDKQGLRGGGEGGHVRDGDEILEGFDLHKNSS